MASTDRGASGQNSTLALESTAEKTTSKEAASAAPAPPFSKFTKVEKVVYIYIASLAAFASPVSSSIYYPAMTTLATELDVSLTAISLTITTYLIFQGVSPTIVGGISDRYGRRLAYMLCFIVFVAANLGLALQTNYAALLVLRCVQSAGSSGTTALSSATVADLVTRQQRGSYIGLAALGSSMGPALGPVIGGLLDYFLGWRAIFWFLTIYGGVMLLVYVVFIPETCRNIVGNGTMPPQRWNKPLVAFLWRRDPSENEASVVRETVSNKKRPGLLSSIPIILEKESFLILFYVGIIYSGMMIIITGLAPQLAETYQFNSIQVGLCYIAVGAGPLLVRPFVGRVMDWNFRRHARIIGVEVVKNQQQNIENFPVERARLEVSLALAYLSCASIIPYGWVMWMSHPPLPAVLVCLFIMAMSVSAAFQPVSALIIDIHPRSAAAAAAANNLLRCLLGAGAVSFVNPLFDRLGFGWAATLVAGVCFVMSVCWWIVMTRGPKWRKAKKDKEDV